MTKRTYDDLKNTDLTDLTDFDFMRTDEYHYPDIIIEDDLFRDHSLSDTTPQLMAIMNNIDHLENPQPLHSPASMPPILFTQTIHPSSYKKTQLTTENKTIEDCIVEEYVNKYGKSNEKKALAYAQKHNDIDMIFLLTDYYAPPIETLAAYIAKNGANKNTALLNATRSKKLERVKELIQAGATCNDKFKNPLHLAASTGDIEIMKVLLLHFKDKVNSLSQGHSTPLHYAIEKGRIEIIQLLLNAGANVNGIHLDKQHLSPLHAAIRKNRKDIIDLLIKSNVDLNILSNELHREKMTALHYAASVGNSDMVEFLLTLKKINNWPNNPATGNTALHLTKNPKVIQILLNLNRRLATSHFDVNVKNLSGQTALFYYIIKQIEQTEFYLPQISQNIALLIQAGANLYLTDNQRNTVLHIAARNARPSAVNDIIRHIPADRLSAFLSQENNEGKTAIVIAFEQGNIRTQAALAARGAILPAHLRRPTPQNQVNRELNSAQSTHTTSVHVSCSKSAMALQEYYKLKNIEQARQALLAWGKTLPTDSLKSRAAKNCLHRMQNLYFTDRHSSVKLQTLLGLVWLAINEFNQGKPDALISFLYEIQRGRNINHDAKGVDDEKYTDAPICVPGHFNKLIESLVGIHPSVILIFVTRETILTKADELVNQAFLSLPDEEKSYFSERWTEQTGMPEELIAKIKPNIEQALHADFDEFGDDVPDYHNVISDFLTMLEYKSPTRSVIPPEPASPAEKQISRSSPRP